MENILLVTQNGYGISVFIAKKELEVLKRRLEKNDSVIEIEER